MKQNMRFSLFLIVGLFAFFSSHGQEAKQTIKITNLENVEGSLYIGWYKDAQDFRINEKAIYREKIEVTNQSEVSVQFNNIPKGKYAIAVFLVENDNYKLDRNLFGIPTEKYGFSNNILPALRAATFEESVFQVDEQGAITIIKLK